MSLACIKNERNITFPIFSLAKIGNYPIRSKHFYQKKYQKTQLKTKRGCVISLWHTLFYVIYCIILEIS